MVGAVEYQAGELVQAPSVVTYFFFHFSQKYKFCSAGRIACASTYPVTDE